MMNCRTLTATITSPVGDWVAVACQKGLHLVKLGPEVRNDNFLAQGTGVVALKNGETEVEKNIHILDLLKWMTGYFSGTEGNNNSLPTLKICPEVSGGEHQNFRQKVWMTLLEKVAFGETVSYGRLAELCGAPGAARAVGSAMANNPITLVVPCHRVIKAGGATGNYAKSTKNDIKVWLLNHESGGKI